MKRMLILGIAAVLLQGCAFSIGAWVKTGDNVHKVEYTTPEPAAKLPMTGSTTAETPKQ